MKRRRKRCHCLMRKKQKGGSIRNFGRPPPIWGGYKWGRNGNMVSILRNQRGGWGIALQKYANRRARQMGF